MYTGKYRTQSFETEYGSYVQVYQRPNQRAILDVNFFEGDHDEESAANCLAILVEGHALQKKWNLQSGEEPDSG